MKPSNLSTKIFLDSGDPEETKEAIALLGFLDGQTTNPSLIAKNPTAKERFERGEKFQKEEIYDFYKNVVMEISKLIPDGSVSVEVYADKDTKREEMLKQGREMFGWIGNAHIKLPVTTEGLKTAKEFVSDGIRVNMTLCFSQEQAAAVYAATKGAKKGGVFLSPFVGRLDDRGENGMSLIKNIQKLYKNSDQHVEILVASVRSMEHFLYSLSLKADLITAPLKILKQWAGDGMPMPGDDYLYKSEALKDIEYGVPDLNMGWGEYNIVHSLTDAGIERFSKDWNELIIRQ